MPTFVIHTVHSADQCPTANSKIRERLQQDGPQMPKVAERLNVKIVMGPLVLAPEHEGVVIVEAEHIGAVNDFLLESGLVQWQTCRVSLAQPLADALGELPRLPAAIY